MSIDPRLRGTPHRTATRRPSWLLLLLRGRDGNNRTMPSSKRQQENSHKQKNSAASYDCDDKYDGASSSSSSLSALPSFSPRGRRRIADHDRQTFSISHATERRLRLSLFVRTGK